MEEFELERTASLIVLNETVSSLLIGKADKREFSRTFFRTLDFL